MEKATRHETAEKTYSWKLTTFEKQGNLWLEWTTNAPFRAQQDLIKVYKNGFPRDPNASSAAWNYADKDKTPWDTGLRYGADWYCARIAQAAPNGPYVYMEQIITKG